MRLRLAILMLGALLMAAPAFAQGCSMCATSAGGAGPRAQKSLARGVEILLFPTLGLIAIVAGVTYRMRH
jgi:hypothetical protein